jgi:hypothetical protein
MEAGIQPKIVACIISAAMAGRNFPLTKNERNGNTMARRVIGQALGLRNHYSMIKTWSFLND